MERYRIFSLVTATLLVGAGCKSSVKANKVNNPSPDDLPAATEPADNDGVLPDPIDPLDTQAPNISKLSLQVASLSRSLSVTITGAADDSTPTSELRYTVYVSESPMPSLSDAEKLGYPYGRNGMGDAVPGYLKDSVTLIGLKINQRYWVGVAVTDNQGNQSYFSSKPFRTTQTVDAPTMLVDQLITDGSSVVASPFALGSKKFVTCDLGFGNEPCVFDADTIKLTVLADTTATSSFYQPHGVDSSVVYLGATDDFVVFQAEVGRDHRVVYKSSGTPETTEILQDFSGSEYSWNAQQFYSSGTDSGTAHINNKVIFRAYEGLYDVARIYVSDGTPAGTKVLKDVNPAGSDGVSTSGAMYLGSFYFLVGNNDNGTELWKTDGTEAGTIKVKTFFATKYFNSAYMNVFNGDMYFLLQETNLNTVLWKSDGTDPGTVAIKQVGSLNGYNFFIGNLPTKMLLKCDLSEKAELCESDGTAAGTVSLKDINPGAPESGVNKLLVDGGTMYLSATTATQGAELWKTDGTAAGTVLVKDIAVGTDHSGPYYMQKIGPSNYVFRASTTAAGYELWGTDGTEAGTVLLKDINPGGLASNPISLWTDNGKAYFTALSPHEGHEFWETDGTVAGTKLFLDANKQVLDIYQNIMPHNSDENRVVFYQNTVDSSIFYESKGTTESTAPSGFSLGPMVIDQYFGPCSVNGIYCRSFDDEVKAIDPFAQTVTTVATLPADGYHTVGFQLKDRFIFSSTDLSTYNAHLHEFDGTAAGTSPVESFIAFPYFPIDLKGDFDAGLVYSKAIGPINAGLYVYDGSSHVDLGTFHFLTNASNGKLVVYDKPFPDFSLWVSDGTLAGTQELKDHMPGELDFTSEIVAFGDLFAYSTNDATIGNELWITDGTTVGTGVPLEINPGAGGSFPKAKFVLGDQLYFTAYSPEFGRELWRTDGTASGTTLVKDIAEGPDSSVIGGLAEANGDLYFVRHIGNQKFEVWLSNGKASGTRKISEFDSFPDLVQVSRDFLWITADARLYSLAIR